MGTPPRRPPMGALLGHPFPAGCSGARSAGHPDPIIVCAPGRGVASSLAPGAARVWSSLGCGRPRAPAPFLRTPRPHLRRGPCPCAGPLRRGAPAARPSRLPPGSPVRPLLRAPRGGSSPSRGAHWPRLPGPPPRFAAGSLAGDRSPLRRLGAVPWAARGPAGSPPARPLSRLRGRRLQPRGALIRPWAPRGFYPRARPRALRAGAPAAASFALFNRCPWSLGSPPNPLPSPAPAGGRGRRETDLRPVASFSAAGFSRDTFPRNGPFSRSPSHC